MRRSLSVALLAVPLLASVTVAGCGGGSSTGRADGEITVFAAASLTGPFREMATAYEEAHPGRKVRLSFAASSELAAQINQGAPVDVFASADLANMNKLTAGTVAAPREFASNRLESIVGAGNPKGITGLADLAKPGLAFVSADVTVPIGKYTAQVLAKAGIEVSPKSLEANVKGIVTKVTLGEADAGIVYVTDVLAAGAKAQGIAIPADLNVVARYPIAVPATTPHQRAGADFIDFVLSAAGRRILEKYGFAT